MSCPEANVMFIVLFRPLLAGLELTLHRHMFSQKRLNYTISYDFHNLEILSFQTMYGLLGFIREMKALQRSVCRRFLRVWLIP